MSADLAFEIELPVARSDFRADVIAGLSASPKSIPPKYFYDKTGAELFVGITKTPEYYPTLTEMALLETIAPEVAAWVGEGASLIEPGSGAAKKIRVLLSAMADPYECVLTDISAEQLRTSGQRLAEEFPGLRVGAVTGDFTGAMPRPEDIFTGSGRRLCFFPGSTLGNFDPVERLTLLQSYKSVLRQGDAILLGVDGVKDTARLDAAYNDSEGKTAAFNLNLLTRLKTELSALVDETAFQHLSFYNPQKKRIEMHLVAHQHTEIVIENRVFEFQPGEAIHTEDSWKFDEAALSELAEAAGLKIQQLWQSARNTFYLALLEVL